MRTVIVRLAMLLLFGFPSGRLWAQLAVDRDALLLSPSTTSSRFADVVVRNTSGGEIEASIGLQDWDVDAAGASRWRKRGDVRGSCGSRVSVAPASIRLGPGEQHTVRVSVNDGARFDAECWSAVVVQPTRMAARPFSNERTVMSRATVPLYVTPAGLVADGEVRDLFIARDSINVVFANLGRVRADIVGEVQVRTPDDSVLVLALPLQDATVLAGGSRTLRVAMPSLRPGRYQLLGVVDFGGTSLTAARAALEIR
jgi:hypothetical protein